MPAIEMYLNSSGLIAPFRGVRGRTKGEDIRMRSVKTFNLVLLICALAFIPMASQIEAQVATGDLSGRVEDSQGAVLPGVTITATSPNLQGERIVTSDTNGVYRIPLMPPGTYTVTYELEGFATAVRQIKINAGTTTRSNPLQLPLSEVQEEIIVTGELETISKTGTGSATFEQEEMNKLPVQRNLADTTLLAPGTSVSAVGDESATVNTSVTISGAMSFENLFLMNGVVMSENIRGQAFDLFIEDAIQETIVSASGISAEYGRFSGGVVNAITKSGGNQFAGSARVTYNNNDWEARTPLSAERNDEIVPTYEATLGGYFWKDHLWFFGAYRDTETSDAQTTRAVTNIPFIRVDTETRAELKGTISPHPSHSIVASYLEIDEAQNNRGSFTFIDLRSLTNRTLPQEMIAVNYTGILTSKFFIEAQYSEREFLFVDSGSKSRDFLEGTLMRRRGTSHRYHSPTFCGAGPPACPPEERSNENILAKGSYFLTTGKGTHDIVFGYDTFDDIRFSINRQTGTDFTVWASDIVVDPSNNIFTQFNGDDTWIGWWAVFNEDIAQPTNFTTNSFYVNDSWQLNDHWSFNVGLRYDINDGQNSSGVTTADDEKISPRLSASYDVKGDGDLVVFASFGQYVAAIANSRADATTTGGAIGLYLSTYEGPLVNNTATCETGFDCASTQDALETLFDWYFQNGTMDQYFANPSLIPGNLFSVSVPGVTSGVPNTIVSPSVQEIAVGVTKRLGAKGLVRADLVFRDWEDFYGDRNGPGNIVDTTAGPIDFAEVGNFNAGLSREYMGLHTQARYRVMDRLTVAGTYTYSQLEGNIVGETTGSGPVPSGVEQYREYKELSWNAPKGDLAGDSRHKLRAWAEYDVLDWEHHHFGVSWLENYFSGTPYGAFEDINPEPFVENPGYSLSGCCDTINYWFIPRDAFHTDDVHRSDLSLNYSFRWNAFGRQMSIFVRPDVLNIFDEQAIDNVNNDIATSETASSTCPGGCQPFDPFTTTPVEGVHWQKRSDFGQPEDEFDYQFPRTYRISIGFRF